MKPKYIIIFCIVVFFCVGGYLLHHKFGIARNDLLKLQLSVFPDNPKALLQMAENLRNEDGFDSALKEYKHILRLQAEGLSEELKPNPDVIQRVQKVMKIYNKVIAVDPENVEAHYRLGIISEELGLTPIAFTKYLEAVKLDPLFIDVHYRLAGLYIDAGDYAQAAKAFTSILKLLPEEENAYLRIIAMITDALKKDPENSIMRHSRREVVEKFTQLINGKPKTAELYYNLGLVLAQMGDIDRAVSAYRSALDLDKDHVGTLNNLGDMSLRSGNLSEAQALFEKAVKLDPKLTAPLMNLGTIEAKKGNLQAAKNRFEDVLKIDPENSQAYFKLAFISEAAGKLMEAKEQYAKAITFGAEDPDVFYNAGNVHIKLGLGQEALNLYRMALKNDPDHLNAAVNGCLLAVEMQLKEQAANFCSEAEILGYTIPAEVKAKL